jgi:hypothetical protein
MIQQCFCILLDILRTECEAQDEGERDISADIAAPRERGVWRGASQSHTQINANGTVVNFVRHVEDV